MRQDGSPDASRQAYRLEMRNMGRGIAQRSAQSTDLSRGYSPSDGFELGRIYVHSVAYSPRVMITVVQISFAEAPAMVIRESHILRSAMLVSWPAQAREEMPRHPRKVEHQERHKLCRARCCIEGEKNAVL